MTDNPESTGTMLVVNLYPDQTRTPNAWRSEDLGSPSVLFRRGDRGWVAHLEKQAVARAETPEALAADVYGEYGVLAVLHPAPLEATA
ncbi:MAG: hypothetical protein WC876_11350 [Candidatus Thermoplasmatota archaeon]|jgi:hypothetical protein